MRRSSIESLCLTYRNAGYLPARYSSAPINHEASPHWRRCEQLYHLWQQIARVGTKSQGDGKVSIPIPAPNSFGAAGACGAIQSRRDLVAEGNLAPILIGERLL